VLKNISGQLANKNQHKNKMNQSDILTESVYKNHLSNFLISCKKMEAISEFDFDFFLFIFFQEAQGARQVIV